MAERFKLGFAKDATLWYVIDETAAAVIKPYWAFLLFHYTTEALFNLLSRRETSSQLVHVL